MPDLPISESTRSLVTNAALAIIRDAGPSAYGLLVVHGPSPSRAVAALAGVGPQDLIAGRIKHPDDAAAVLAGLYLWLDALSESHTIAQDVASPTGSFWHAIMHRREGDFSNAKYWYRRCAGHHVIKQMGAIASSLARGFESDRQIARVLSNDWNPEALVDLVEALHDKPNDPRHPIAVRLQRAEWSGIFDYCVHQAVEADRDGLDAWDRRVNAPS